MSKRKLAVTFPLCGALLFAVASCSSQSSGQPQPNNAQTASHTPTRESTPNTKVNNTKGLKTKNPCSFLNESNRQSLEVENNGKQEKIGTARTCSWDGDDLKLTVAIRTNAGLNDVNDTSGELQNVTIGDHKSVKNKTPSSCEYYIGVSSSSRVDILAIKGADPDCDAAKNLAEIVESKLPKS